MSIARHHAEWLALTEISGPFLSLEVLLQIFPQGLDAHDPEHFRLLRQAYQEWSIEKADRAIHRAWIEWVLQNTLGFPEEILQTGQAIASHLRVEIPQHQETLVPDWVVVDPDTNKAQLLIQQVSPSQKLEGTYKNSHWAASPATRLIELLRGTDIRLGLLTNGEQWMLIHVPKLGTASLVSWYGNLWVEEKITLRSFRALIGVQRFFGVAETETLAQLFERSKNHQQEITDQLGLQVRRSVEVLVQRLDRIDQDYQGQLLAGISDQMLYEAALFVMMRLVFLLSAEEKGLLLLGQERYDKNYALSTLQQSLREMADHSGEEILERRYDAWYRLLALFRAVHGGVYHHNFQLPAYGGDLFDPDKFPFLEGRFGEQTRAIAIDNRTVLHLLESLQILQVKVPGGGVEPRRLSFKGLEVEQIGHVYESLLDHRVVRADSTVLGLEGTKSKDPEVALAVLEVQAEKGEEALLEFLKKETGRSVTALKKLIAPLAPQDWGENDLDLSKSPSIGGFRGPNLTPYEENRYLIGCRSDRALWSRIKPFYRLIRKDTYGNPLIIPEGSVYVTTGTARRESGTHYTPKHLTEEIVKYTLEPLVYEGVSEGKPQEEWRLISVQALLNLKICDPTMGSGAFLVQVCRYLADRLVEAWADLEERHPKQVFTVFGNISKPGLEEGLLPDTPEERLIVAKRLIAERCLYGVDKNSLAVEMAKLSLWLETLQKDRPFTFVDHALRCGDSLVGVSVDQLRFWSLDTSDSSYQLGIGADEVQRLLKEAIDKRLEIEQFSVVSTQDQKRKESLLAEADARLKDLKDRANLLVSSYLANVKKSEQEDLRAYLLMVANGKADIRDYQRRDLPDLDQLRPFHWELEFPEVFQPTSKKEGENIGFDAIVGNPPFLGGKKITGALGTPYRDYLVEWIGNDVKGNADLCAYFFLRIFNLLKQKTNCGLVSTNTIAQGDTREVGLDQIAKNGIIYRAVPSRPWSGTAALEVAYVWLKKGNWQGKIYLDEQPVKGITPYLTVPGDATGTPYQLKANAGKSFIGSYVLGMGFVLEPEEAQALIAKNPKNKDVLFPYLNGQDLNTNPDQAPSRWVINFFDWPLSPEQDDPKKPKGAPYASDYPDCLEIVERLTKPQREKVNRKVYREKWWIYAEKQASLYEAITELSKNSDQGSDRVLVRAQVSRTHAMCFTNTDQVISMMCVILIFNTWKDFSLLQCNLHEIWVNEYSSSLKKDQRYTPTDCFETFPFPDLTLTHQQQLEDIGKRYYEHRQAIMQRNQEGLTKTYNRFHDPDETDPDIQKLRELHIEMDNAVAIAYGWQDLIAPLSKGGWGDKSLNHDFHNTKQGLRFTISETARREILDRLLQLNHQRYAQEVEQGLHDKTKKKASKPKKQTPKDPNQLGLDL